MDGYSTFDDTVEGCLALRSALGRHLLRPLDRAGQALGEPATPKPQSLNQATGEMASGRTT